jgi:predicted transcriptional regulator
MGTRSNSQAAEERQIKVAEMYFNGYSNLEIAAALGAAPSVVADDIDSLRREWFLLSKQDADEARGEELARTNYAEKLLLREWERSRTKQSETVQKSKGGDVVTTLRRETQCAKPQIISTVLKCVATRCRMREARDGRPRLPDWNMVAEQCKAMDRTVIVPPGYPWPETGDSAA